MMSVHAWSPVQFFGTNGKAPFVLICEHASKLVPTELDSLGLDDEAQHSHAAWDIGALSVATKLSRALDAPLVAGGVSRLVYDLNRPHDANDAMPAKSEVFAVPGNEGLSEAKRAERYGLVHEPFPLCSGPVDRSSDQKTEHCTDHHHHSQLHARLSGLSSRRGNRFSIPPERQFQRSYPDNRKLARTSSKTALNEPYNATDGVTYSLRRHAEDRGLDNTMIEIRNDLIASEGQCDMMAQHLAKSILEAQSHLQAMRKEPT